MSATARRYVGYFRNERGRLVSGPTVSLSEALLTVDDAARLLGVKPSTVYDWVRAGSLPA